MIKVTLEVNPELAILAGSTKIGSQTLTINEAQLAELTPTQRETLAKHVGGRPRWSLGLCVHAKPIAVADLATLASLLDQRHAWATEQDRIAAEEAEAEAEAKRKNDEKVRALLDHYAQAPIDELLDAPSTIGRWQLLTLWQLPAPQEAVQRVTGLMPGQTIAAAVNREAEATSERERRNLELNQRKAAEQAERERQLQAQREARVAFLRRHGFDEPAEREAAGVLPLPELHEIVRPILFASLGEPWAPPTTYWQTEVRIKETLTASQWAAKRELESRIDALLPTPEIEELLFDLVDVIEWHHDDLHPDADADGDVQQPPYPIADVQAEWLGVHISARYPL